MAGNKDLQRAKTGKKDEFYTQYSDIQSEMNAYLEYNPDVFKDKVILLPCDDPEWSNFTKYFAQHFEDLGLKKLISTSYANDSKQYIVGSQVSIWELSSPKYDETKTNSHGKIFVLERDKTSDKNGDSHIDINDLDFDYLEGDGDFRSLEVKKLRDEADIIITNPPFSLFREFVAWIMEADKKFIIVGNQNAINYKEIFPLLMDNKMWVGKRFAERVNGDHMLFRIPDDYPIDTDGCIKDGKKYIENSMCGWFTNIDHGRRHETLDTMTMENQKRFSKHKEIKGHDYLKYDNYDAIEIPFTDAIPKDYAGVMGVPISFMRKYCPEQFVILGASQRGCHENVQETRTYDDYIEINHKTGKPTGSSGRKTNGNPNLEQNDGVHNYFTNGERIVQSLYGRIFIRFSDSWIANHPEDFKNGGAKL